MKNINYILLLPVLFAFTTLFSQSNANKGDRYFDKNLFQDAIKYYQLEIKNGNRKSGDYAMQKLADCYRILGEFELAEETYKKILKKKRNQEDPMNFFNYGQSLKSSAKYEEAKIQFNEYIRMRPLDPMGEVLLHSCDSAQKWLEETIGKEIVNVEKLNSELSDFSPVIINENELVFSSSRVGSKNAFISFNGGLEVDRTDIYSVNLTDVLVKEKLVPKNIKELNSPFHEGVATFSEDGNEVYFTRTIKGTKDKKTNEVISTLQVFYSKKDTNGIWSEPISAFKYNSDEYSIGHPSLSKDGMTLFFISDMPGGYGNTDIFFVEKREDGSWNYPTNIGSNINTFGHELFPYIAENGTLYFSSDGHPGMGKLDIFSAKKVKKEWTNVSNLKPPYNSIGNDFGFVLDGDDFRGFLSSDRFNGKGAEDIYSFSEEIPIKVRLEGSTIKILNKSVFDGLEYTMVAADSSDKELSFLLNESWYIHPLRNNVVYTISARKNRMPYNTIKLKLNNHSEKNYFELEVESSNQEIILEGDVIKVNNDEGEENLEYIQDAKTILKLKNDNKIQTTQKEGNFKFKIDANQEYLIFSPIK